MLHYRFCLICMAAIVVPVSTVPTVAQDTDDLLNPLFQDGVVLQRGTPIEVWGSSAPGDTVSVVVAGRTTTAVANEEGRWTAQLPALTGGGPHELVAHSTAGGVQTVRNVLVGDVFLCSGQSNMELPVHRALDARAQIANAANDRMRMLTVDHASSAQLQQTLPRSVEWEIASSETVSDWSATCYYFARDLQQHVDVPIGLVHSSWGGSSITAWMSRTSLSSIEGYDDWIALLDRYTQDPKDAHREFGRRWEAWWHRASNETTRTEPWQPQAGAEWPRAPAGLGSWKAWDDPSVSTFHGMLWHRSTFELTAEQARQGGVLSLGPVDAVDQTWINGKIVGNTFGWGDARTYSLPSRHLHEGENVVVVNVLSTYGSGGMLKGPPSRFFLAGTGDRLPLESWRYRKEPSDTGLPPRTPWDPIAGLSTLHNAMLAPLHKYSFRGVVWYQGESDTEKGRRYLDLLQALKTQWRDQFGPDLPVLVVQLANYGPVSTEPTESAWAEVREAQRRATREDPHSGLAVTIDIGSPYDIHPANKQEVGHRLARAGRHVIYDKDVTPSGPVPVRAVRDDEEVTVAFEDVEGTLLAQGHDVPIGFELCESEPGQCEYANAEIDGRQVRLRVPDGAEPARVRYCWGDSPVCTLYDETGLPAGPFEISISSE